MDICDLGQYRDLRSGTPKYQTKRSAFGIKPTLFDRTDVHVHVPDGATPKDGPSAGAAMATAIVSVLTGVPIRKELAMTGEVTLRGRVTAIGGLKEKLLAALRSGVTTVLIPQENEKDLADVPETVKAHLKIVPVSHMDEVLKWALTGPLTPIAWTEEDDAERAATLPAASVDDLDEGTSPTRAH